MGGLRVRYVILILGTLAERNQVHSILDTQSVVCELVVSVLSESVLETQHKGRLHTRTTKAENAF